MPIQILGMIGHRKSSEVIASSEAFDKQYIQRFAQAHEQAGFDRVLVGYWSDQADGFLVTAHAAAHTAKIKFLLAHRPGFVAPTLAARKFATLDQLTDGRLGVHIISGANDFEQQKDGDFLNKVERYERSAEFIDLIRTTWQSQTAFDYDGKYYQIKNAFSEIKPVQQHLPIYFGGSSPEALKVASQYADVFALWGEPLAGAKEHLNRLNALADRQNRRLQYNISFRPIIAATQQQAWEKAEQIYQKTKQRLEQQGKQGLHFNETQGTGGQRLLDAARTGEVLDQNLWMGMVSLVKGNHNSTALVGTPEQVAEAILRYYQLGIGGVLIRGFDPLNDVIDYGRELIPLIREKTQEFDRNFQKAIAN